MKNYSKPPVISVFAYVVFSTACFLSASVHADGFRNPPEGPWAIGRIGGHTAQGDELTAVIHNPANLCDMATGACAQASMTAGFSETKYTSPSDASDKTQDPFSYLPCLIAAVPLTDGGLTLGLGVHVPFGRAATWDKNGPLRYAAPHYAALSALDFRPVLAFRLDPAVSVAVGLDAVRSRIDYRQYVPWAMMTGAAVPDGEMRLDAEGWSLGANLAAAWQPLVGHRVALTWRSPFRVEYEGDLDLDYVPPGSGIPNRNDVKTSIDFPAIVAAAYGLDLGNGFRVEAQVEWIGFSSFETLDVEAGAASVLIPPSMRAQDWKDTRTFGVAGDWRATPEWSLRAGLLYLESPVPNRTFTPFMADEDQPVLSVGAGYRPNDHHALDVGYAIGLFDGRRIQDNNNPAYDGDYEFQAHLLSIGYRIAF